MSDKGISPLNSLLHARQEMFDNVYWHHTNRAMMAMLLRAVQEAVAADALDPQDLSTHDDASLLALLSTPSACQQATRELVDALRLRQPYKVLLEVSGRAGRVYHQLDALFWDQPKRRRVEIALAAGARARRLEAEIAPHDAAGGRPQAGEVGDGCAGALQRVRRSAWRRQMTWTEATGQRPSDLGVYEQHQRRIRIVASERVRELVGDRAEALLLPALERVPAM